MLANMHPLPALQNLSISSTRDPDGTYVTDIQLDVTPGIKNLITEEGLENAQDESLATFNESTPGDLLDLIEQNGEVPEDLLDFFDQNGNGVITFSEEDLRDFFRQQNVEGAISVGEIQAFFASRMITGNDEETRDNKNGGRGGN